MAQHRGAFNARTPLLQSVGCDGCQRHLMVDTGADYLRNTDTGVTVHRVHQRSDDPLLVPDPHDRRWFVLGRQAIRTKLVHTDCVSTTH